MPCFSRVWKYSLIFAEGTGVPLLAGDGGGDAFAQLVLGQSVLLQYLAGLIHHVDPARRNVVAQGVNFACTAALYPTDLDEKAVFDRDIRFDPGIAIAVEQASVADQRKS